MRRAWIAAAHCVLRLALPTDEAETVLGDLIEDAGGRPSARVFLAAWAVAAHRTCGRRRGSPRGDRRNRSAALTSDLRSAMRTFSARPGFTVTVVTTLALATGAGATMFAIVDAVLLRPLPFSDRAVWVGSFRADNPDAPFTLPEFMDYRERTRSLDGLAAYGYWTASLATDGVTERFQGARMSANAFDVLGATAAAGRLLRDDDDRPGADRVVVISHRLWRDHFGAATAIAGRRVRINAEPYTVVGVLPSGFSLPLRDIDVVTPLSPDLDPLRHARGSVNFLRLFGRLKRDVSMGQAEEELTAICADLRRQFPAEYVRKEGVRVKPLYDAVVGSYRSGITLLFVSVLIVMAAALANLLCLVLIRSHDRRAEISIRIALGASRPRIARQFAIEAIVLAAAGAAIGSLLAAAVITLAPAWAPAAIPRLADARIDGRTLAFVAALSALAATLVALAAIATLLRTPGELALRRAESSTGGDRASRRLRDVLVAGEIASAIALLLATTLLARDFRALQRVDPGFDPDPVFQARVTLPPTYRSPADVARFVDRLTERAAMLPGVRQVGLVSVAPLSGLLLTVPFTVAGQPELRRPDMPNANLRQITPGYLDAAGTRLLRGRAFTAADRHDAPRVALVNAALADRLLGAEPIGQRLLIDDNNTGPRPVDVVGVVENVQQLTIGGPPPMDIYIPLHQVHPDGAAFVGSNHFWVLRVDGDPGSVGRRFVSALQEIDRDAAISSVGTLRRYVDAWFAPRRFSLWLFTAFAVTTALLSITGLYGLIAYTVRQRRREIGLRMALGATAGSVRRLFMAHAAKLSAAGVAVGLIVTFLARPLAAQLTTGPTVDIPTAIGVAASLFAVVLLAAWLPSRRAARVGPNIALKID
jgi:predicted permease